MAERPRLHDIAQKAGVSRMTASLALRNRPNVSAGVREKVQQVARELGWRPDPNLSQMMSHIRSSDPGRLQANLAILSCTPRAKVEWGLPMDLHLQGIERRCHELGYDVDYLWLGDPRLPTRSLTRILQARGVKGLILVDDCLPYPPRSLDEAYEKFAVVALGRRPVEPAFHYVVHDPARALPDLLDALLRYGFRRPGLACPAFYDMLTEQSVSTAFELLQRNLPSDCRVPALVDDDGPRLLAEWVDREKPDVLLTSFCDLLDQDPAFHHLSWLGMDITPACSKWAGIQCNHEQLGMAAVDLLIGEMNAGAVGVPSVQRRVSINSTWVNGPSLRRKRRRFPESWHMTWERRYPGSGKDMTTGPLPLATRDLVPVDQVESEGGTAYRPKPLTSGAHVIHGINFEVADGTGTGIGGALRLPRAKEMPLYVGQTRCEGLCFLHACTGVRTREVTGDYVVGLASGKEIAVEMVAVRECGEAVGGETIQDWWQLRQEFLTTDACLPAWMGRTGHQTLLGRALFTFRWAHPDPEDPLVSVRWRGRAGAQATMHLLALSAINPRP